MEAKEGAGRFLEGGWTRPFTIVDWGQKDFLSLLAAHQSGRDDYKRLAEPLREVVVLRVSDVAGPAVGLTVGLWR